MIIDVLPFDSFQHNRFYQPAVIPGKAMRTGMDGPQAHLGVEGSVPHGRQSGRSRPRYLD
jgi:hypothetical protein